jgi:glycerol uptake facilitator-like aquaporin
VLRPRVLQLSDRNNSIAFARAMAAEGIGTALLLAAVVGSGIMGERLAGGTAGIALLCNSIATGAALIALILTFGPISGAHFNPAVSLAACSARALTPRQASGYVLVQIFGALSGVAVAHAMFQLPLLTWSHHAPRDGWPQILGEIVATFGLIAVIVGCSRRNDNSVALAVGAYIVAAFWFTSSTSFANPAVTIARSFTDTFTGIRFVDVGGFLFAQTIGTGLAVVLFKWVLPASKPL